MKKIEKSCLGRTDVQCAGLVHQFAKRSALDPVAQCQTQTLLEFCEFLAKQALQALRFARMLGLAGRHRAQNQQP
jgi:hypothetical protein